VVSQSLGNSWNSRFVQIRAMKNIGTLEQGWASQTPFKPNHPGNVKSMGRRKIRLRTSKRHIDVKPFPIPLNIVSHIIRGPNNGSMETYIRSAGAAMVRSSGSFVKAASIGRAKISIIRQLSVATINDIVTPIRTICLRRS
jgi:hypothetical protein